MGIDKQNKKNGIKNKSGSKSAKMLIGKSMKSQNNLINKKSQKKLLSRSNKEMSEDDINDKVNMIDDDDAIIELEDKENAKSTHSSRTSSESKPLSEKKISSESKTSSEKKTSSETNPRKKMNELDKLYSFMNKYRVESQKKSGKNLPWTHTCTYIPYGSYNIPEDMNNQFFKLYEDAIIAGYNPHIVEKHREIGPIVIDLDFVQDKEHPDRSYTNKTLVNVIKIYNNIIKKYLDVPNHRLDAFILEKKLPNFRKGEYHDGVHIIYPYICTKPSLQMLMREEAIEMITEHKIFKKMPLVKSRGVDKIIDESVIYKNGFTMYGSIKDPKCHVYKLTHVFSSANGKIIDTYIPDIETNPKSHTRFLIKLLSIRRFTNEDDITPFKDDIDPNELTEQVKTLADNITKKTKSSKEEIRELMGTNMNFVNAVSDNVLTEAKNLVKLLSKERATDFWTWYQVGKCLHNIDYRLLKDWIRFSKKCPEKYVEGECVKLWRKMKSSNYSMASLHFFASKDNPDKYIDLQKSRIADLVYNGLEGSNRAIAKLIVEKYRFKYRCASIKHNIWYEFKNHRWVEIDSAYSLRNLISDELYVDYSRYLAAIYTEAEKTEGYDKQKYHNDANNVRKLMTKLNNQTFKNGVIRECADMIYDPNFLRNLDENIYLICFENGVYDLEQNCFRDGCPDDYVSLCTGYKYMEYDENDEVAIEINDFMKKIQTDEIMREYLLTLLSTCLAGSIKEESFYVFTGTGANGKSKLMELLKHTLGDYYKPMDIRLLTEKRSSSSSASPEVADKKGIRACPFDEPKSSDEINTGFMKLFTGGDVIMARALFKEPIYFKPQFKPFLLCNHLPAIRSDDEGTWRRIRVIPFESKFIKKSDATSKQLKYGLDESKNQFWADKDLSEKIPEWKQVFMGMLLHYYKKYTEHGLVHPKLVMRYTEDYKKKCDVFQDFIGDYLEKTNNPDDAITMINLHECMRNWYKSNYDGKCPNTKDIRNYVEKRLDALNKKTDSLIGYRLKTNGGEELGDELLNI